MRVRASIGLLLLAVVVSAGCSKDDKKSEAATASKDESKADDKAAADDDSAKKKHKKKHADDGEANETANTGGDEPAGNDDDPSAVPGARSKVPTKAEMDAADDVAIDGAKELGCETRMVREWIQIACRGSGAKAPTYVEVTKGKTKDTLVATIPGVSMSVKTPYEPGVELEATFWWGDSAKKLTLAKWPLKKKRPVPIGALSDAGSGLSPEKAAWKHYCACKTTTGGAKCDDATGEGSTDCFRTYWADCAKMVQCQNGEPGVWPTCLPGHVNAGLNGACAQDCSKGAKCPKGKTCQDTPTGKRACLE